ncbi:MAG TPA: autotransporter-associated beta strand repeat-containing protein [Planctomycetota bacterium]|nr:autotransporter-associated beta strand repeat-containing protein [Planctomycetota bacterium]
MVRSVVLILVLAPSILAADYASSGSGNWDDSATWGGVGVPVAGDNVAIAAHAIAFNSADRACATLTFTGSGSITGANTLTLTGGLSATGTAAATVACATLAWGASLADVSSASTGSLTIGAAISGSGGLTKSGAGVVAVSGTATFTGTTTVAAGTLRLSGASGAVASSTALVIESGGTLDIDDTSTSADRIGDTATVTMRAGTFSWTTDDTRSETIGAMAFTKGHSFVAFNAVTGSPTLTASGGVSRANAATMEFNRGANPYGFLIWTGAAAGLSRWTVVEQGGFVQTGNYHVTNGLTQLGTGTQYTAAASTNWNTASTWTANSGSPVAGDHVMISSGLKVHANIVAGCFCTSYYVFNTSTISCGTDQFRLLNIGGNVYHRGSGRGRIASNFSFGANEGVIVSTGTGSNGIISNWGDAVTMSCTSLTMSGSSITELNGNIDGNANINSATTTAFTGVIAVAGGTCRAGADGALGTAAGATIVYDGATLDIGQSGNDGGYHGQGGVTYSTAEPVTLHGLGVASAGALTNSQGSSSFAGPITLASASCIGANSGTFTLSNRITGAFPLSKLGTGVLHLTYAGSDVAGPTSVGAGTLLVTGSMTSAVALNGGTLRGTGTIGAITAPGADSTVAPGTSAAIGILRAASATVGSASGTMAFRVAAYPTAGTDFDRLDLATAGGSLSLGSMTTLTLDLAGLASVGTVTGLITYNGVCTGTFASIRLLNNVHQYVAEVDYSQTGRLDVIFTKRHFGGSGAGAPNIH